MTSVTIFGAGNMGQAINGVLTSGGASVDHITSSDEGATVTGDIVVLAVPYPALADDRRRVRRPARRQDGHRHHQPAELRDLRLPGRAVEQFGGG